MITRQPSFMILLVAMALFGLFLMPGSAVALSDKHASCDYCHNLHGGPGNNLLNQPNQSDHVLLVEVVCSNCHDAIDPPIASAPQVLSHNETRGFGDWRYISCRECHDPHDDQANAFGGVNLKMVGFKLDPANLGSGFATARIRRIDNDNRSHSAAGTITTVRYENAGPATWDFAVGASDSHVCEVCHSTEDFSDHEGNGDVRGTDCTACHAHGGGFDRP